MPLNRGFPSTEVRLWVLSIMPKFSEILVEKQMERGNFPFKVVHLHRGSSFSPVGLLCPKLAVPFPKFSFPALLCEAVVKISVEM